MTIRKQRMSLQEAVFIFLLIALSFASFTALAEDKEKWDQAELEEIKKLLKSSPFYFELPALGSDEKLNFADLLLESNVIFYFFSSESPICKLQEPFVIELNEWIEKNASGKVRVVGISVAPSQEKVFSNAKKNAKNSSLGFTVLLDPGARVTGEKYQIKTKGVPIFYFFTKGGFPIKVVEGFSRDLISVTEKAFALKEKGEQK